MSTSSRNAPAFSEPEQRFLLGEAIKNSEIPVERLLSMNLVGELQEPNWDHMLLPDGRTMAQCRDAFGSLRRAITGTSSYNPRMYPMQYSSGQKRKSDQLEPISPGPAHIPRRPSGAPADRYIQPRDPTHSPHRAPLTSPTTSSERKKRGRPSKAEAEKRQADAIARGEVLPPPTRGIGSSEGGGVMSTYQPIQPAPPSMLQPPVSKEPQALKLAPIGTAFESASEGRRRPKSAKQDSIAGQSVFSVNPMMPERESRSYADSVPASPAMTSSTGGGAPQSPYHHYGPHSPYSVPPRTSSASSRITSPKPPLLPPLQTKPKP